MPQDRVLSLPDVQSCIDPIESCFGRDAAGRQLDAGVNAILPDLIKATDCAPDHVQSHLGRGGLLWDVPGHWRAPRKPRSATSRMIGRRSANVACVSKETKQYS